MGHITSNEVTVHQLTAANTRTVHVLVSCKNALVFIRQYAVVAGALEQAMLLSFICISKKQPW